MADGPVPSGGVDGAAVGGTGDTGVGLRLVLGAGRVVGDGAAADDVADRDGDGLTVVDGGREAGAVEADAAVAGTAVEACPTAPAEVPAGDAVAAVAGVPPPCPAPVEHETEPNNISAARTTTVQPRIGLRSRIRSITAVADSRPGD